MFLNGVLRRCKLPSACQRYFSLKTLKQRWAVQCVKPITRSEEGAIASGDNVTPFGPLHLEPQNLWSRKFWLHLSFHQCSELTAVDPMKSDRLISS
jgi:hypothetical protein